MLGTWIGVVLHYKMTHTEISIMICIDCDGKEKQRKSIDLTCTLFLCIEFKGKRRLSTGVSCLGMTGRDTLAVRTELWAYYDHDA